MPEEVHIVLEVFIFVLSERDHLGDLGVDARIILRWIIQEVGWGAGNGLDRVAKGRDRWRALVNMVMNFGVP